MNKYRIVDGKLEEIEKKYYKDLDIYNGDLSIWMDFDICSCCNKDFRIKNSGKRLQIFDDYLEWYIPYKVVIEQVDYYEQQKYIINYEYKLKNDDNIYILCCNLKMYSLFYCKWHWSPHKLEYRLYYFDKNGKIILDENEEIDYPTYPEINMDEECGINNFPNLENLKPYEKVKEMFLYLNGYYVDSGK